MFLQCQPAGSVARSHSKDHTVGFSCSKPDRFLGWWGAWVGVSVVSEERIGQVSLQFKCVCPYSAYSAVLIALDLSKP